MLARTGHSQQDRRLRRNAGVMTRNYEIGDGIYLDENGRYTVRPPEGEVSPLFDELLASPAIWVDRSASFTVDPRVARRWSIDATAGPVVVTLPPAGVADELDQAFAERGLFFEVLLKREDASGNSITVQADVNIDGFIPATGDTLVSQWDAKTYTWKRQAREWRIV